MNGDSIPKIACPKCGEMMNADARYCMRCGTINPNLETNKILKKNIQTTIDEYKSGKAPLIKEKSSIAAAANNTGNRTFAFYVTYLLYIVTLIVIGFSAYKNGINTLDFLIISEYPELVIIVSLIFIYIYSTELIFMKCNKQWWAGFIPIYNLMITGDITFHNQYIGLLSLVPVIGQIFMLVMFYKLGEKFKYNGWLTMIFFVIALPIIGLSDHLYEGKVYVTEGDQRSLEKDYRHKKIFVTTFMLFFLCGIALFLMGNMGKVRKTNETIEKTYYVLASKRVVEVVKKSVEENQINCASVTYSADSGVYYISYPDVGNEIHLPLYMMREAIAAYVKIDNSVQPTQYYVSMTDGKYGFQETAIDEITTDTVKNYTSLNVVPSDNVCRIVK